MDYQPEAAQTLASAFIASRKYISDLPLLTDAFATKGDFVLQALSYLLSKKIPDLSVPVNPLAEQSALWASQRGDTAVVWRNGARCMANPKRSISAISASVVDGTHPFSFSRGFTSVVLEKPRWCRKEG
jgi:hypothetical protein